MSALTFRDARPGDEVAVRAVVSSVLAEYGLSADPGGADSDLTDLVANYQDRGGVFRVLATPDGAEAIALYRSFGFVPIDRAHHASRCDRVLGLDLIAAPRYGGG